MLKNEIARLHTSCLIRNKNTYAYPIYKVWNNSEWSKDSTNLTNENEPFWDYYNMIHPLEDLPFEEKYLINETHESKFDHKNYNNDTVEKQNLLNSEHIINNVKENGYTSENVHQYKEKNVPLAKYYRICYDTENGDDYSFGFNFDEISSDRGSMKSLKNSASVVAANDDNIPAFNKNTLDESQFVSVDLNSYYFTEELIKKECPTMDFEKDITKAECCENYWKIA